MPTYRYAVFIGGPKPADQDNHAHAVESDNAEYIACDFDAAGAAEALKSSKKWHVLVAGGRSKGGVEDCHDFCRGGWLTISDHTYERGPAKQDVTLKSGFNGALFNRNPGLRLIEAGNYSKYDAKAIYPDGRVLKASPLRCCRPPVRRCHVTVPPGAPKVQVRLFHSEPWEGDVENIYLVPWPWLHRRIVALYFWARATFWKEIHPAPEEEYRIDPREI
jgi:hypothetical protein